MCVGGWDGAATTADGGRSGTASDCAFTDRARARARVPDEMQVGARCNRSACSRLGRASFVPARRRGEPFVHDLVGNNRHFAWVAIQWQVSRSFVGIFGGGQTFLLGGGQISIMFAPATRERGKAAVTRARVIAHARSARPMFLVCFTWLLQPYRNTDSSCSRKHRDFLIQRFEIFLEK